MESDISFSLCSDQTLVKGKQCLVNFIHIIVSPFDKIFYNDIEFVRMRKGKTCLAEHLLHLDKCQKEKKVQAYWFVSFFFYEKKSFTWKTRRDLLSKQLTLSLQCGIIIEITTYE